MDSRFRGNDAMGPGKVKGLALRVASGSLDEGFLKNILPSHGCVRVCTARAVEVLLSQSPGIHQGDGLEKNVLFLQGDQKEHSLRIEADIEVPAVPCWADPIEQAKGWMIEIAFSSH